MSSCDMWATTTYLRARIDAFDTWALCKLPRIPYSHDIYQKSVRTVSGCHLLSNMVMKQSLRLFGHIACSGPSEDHHRAVAAAIHKPPPDWKWPPMRPNHTWLGTIESDLRPLSVFLQCTKASSQKHWCLIVDMAMLKKSMPWRQRGYVKSELPNFIHSKNTYRIPLEIIYCSITSACIVKLCNKF